MEKYDKFNTMNKIPRESELTLATKRATCFKTNKRHKTVRSSFIQ